MSTVRGLYKSYQLQGTSIYQLQGAYTSHINCKGLLYVNCKEPIQVISTARDLYTSSERGLNMSHHQQGTYICQLQGAYSCMLTARSLYLSKFSLIKVLYLYNWRTRDRKRRHIPWMLWEIKQMRKKLMSYIHLIFNTCWKKNLNSRCDWG